MLQEVETTKCHHLLKCFYINVHSMRKKQEELEALVNSQRSDIGGINETWWDDDL